MKKLEFTKELKQQLAEKDRTITNLVEDNRASQEWYKKQLAESEKKKEDFKTMYFNKCLDYEHLHEKFDDKCAEFELKEYDYKQTIFEKDQDKISFAVAELEKVKVLIHNAVNIASPEYDLVGLYDAVSNQIKQLKEIK